MTGLTRRAALTSATAAVAVVAIPARVQVALASADPQIETLIGQLRAADADHDDNCARYDAALNLIPGKVRESYDAYHHGPRLPIPQAMEVVHTYDRHYEACGAKALCEQADPILDRITELQVQIIHTPAKTLRGALSKARVFWNITALMEGFDETNPDLENNCPRLEDPQFFWSMLQDLERLDLESRS